MGHLLIGSKASEKDLLVWSFSSLEELNQLSVQFILEMKARKESNTFSLLAGKPSAEPLSAFYFTEQHCQIGIILIKKLSQVI